MAKKAKSKLLIWTEYIPFLGLYYFLRILPLPVAYFITGHLFYLLFLLDKKHRLRSIRHIQHAGVATDVAAARKLALQAFDSFSKLLVEIIKVDQCFNLNKLTIRGPVETIKVLFDSGANNQNVIITTAHYGNWELAGTTWSEKTGIPMASIMRPFGNPLIGELILRNRRSDIHEMINKTGGIKGILKALHQHKTVALLVDQHAGKNEGVDTLFFGQPCKTHSTPAQLHLKTGIPIVPQLTRRLDNKFNFEFVVGDLIKFTPTGNKEQDVLTVTQLYTTALEKMIAEHPEQWLWAHRRWLNIHR
jgi:KDO2-lipid IV(A) lauroyltransferase